MDAQTHDVVVLERVAQTVRLMFEDLFNETREVDGRVGRFLFGCDELFRDHRRDHPLSPENDHFHGD